MIIEVDLRDILPAELQALHPSIFEGLVENIAEAARDEWIRLAGAELFTSRRDYINGIQPVRFANGVATITLLGVVPNIVEQGMQETDMRDTLLGPDVPLVPEGSRGKHLVIKPDGRTGFYRVVPFRHATPGTTGAVGQPMGRQYRGHEAVADAEQLGQDVYNAAKKLKATKSDPYKGMQWGERLPAGLAPKLRAHHKTDIFAGMVRERKKYERATQSQYKTFRTISTLVTEGWIRPKTEGRHFAQKVADHVQKLAPKVFQSYTGGIK